MGGSNGLSFTGGIALIFADSTSTSRSVDGFVPQNFEYRATTVSAVIQKDEEFGQLVVRLYKSERLVREESTITEYGVVSVAG